MKTCLQTYLLMYSAPLAYLVLCAMSCQERTITDCEPKRPDLYYNFTQSEKDAIPLGGYETLVFTTGSGDTAKLKGTGRKTSYLRIEDVPNMGCPSFQSRYYQCIDANYSADTGELLRVQLNLSTDAASCSIDINGWQCFNTTLSYLNTESEYLDSVLLKGTYYRGKRFPVSDGGFVVYNHQYGFLKIELPNGKTYFKEL